MSNNERTLPVVQGNTLMYRSNGENHQLTVGTPAWHAWLSSATTFAFQSEAGNFTARREQAGHKRGSWYWRAYRRREGKLHRVYLGTAEELTLQRLRAAAETLATKNKVARVEQEAPQYVLQERREFGDHQVPSHHSPSSDTWHVAESGAAPETIKRSACALPLLFTSLIGREREVTAASTLLLRPEVRELTLTGTGGVGKTRLALQIATEMQEHFPDGVLFVSLTPIRDAGHVLPTIVQALGLQGGSNRSPLEHLKASLHEQHLLLLLDNFEQVVTAAPLLIDLLVACPHLKILVTSRETTQVRGEHLFTVEPLTVPDANHLPDHEALERYGAIALFLERAREVQPSLQLTSENAPIIAEICRRLDGLYWIQKFGQGKGQK